MKLWAQVAGEAGSAIPLVFLHAFPLDSRMWRTQVSHFSRTRRVVAPDARGYGRSRVQAGTAFTIAAYAGDVIDTIDALGIRKAIFVGCSMGGYAIFEIWRNYRDRVAGMVLCDTRAEADTPATKEKRAQQIKRIEREGTGFMVDFASEMLLGGSTREKLPDLISEVRKWVNEAPAPVVAANLAGLGDRADSGDLLATIGVPTLVIVGEEDTVTPLDAAQRLVTEIPNASLAVIADAGHLSPLENPQSANGAIDDFLLREKL